MLRTMNLTRHIPLVVLLAAAGTVQAQYIACAPDVAPSHVGTDCIGYLGNGRPKRTTSRVNARYETTMHKRQADFDRVVTSSPRGYLVRVTGPGGVLRMTGACLDVLALVFHGPFQYYDQRGTLRAEGSYANGIKTGTWQRYDEQGEAMTDKEYDGLDWEHEEVKLGLSTVSGLPEPPMPE